MSNTHVHEILEMISSTGKAYSVAELEAAVVAQFGENAMFRSCSIEDMSPSKAVDFLVSRGKFIPQQAGTSCCGACGG